MGKEEKKTARAELRKLMRMANANNSNNNNKKKPFPMKAVHQEFRASLDGLTLAQQKKKRKTFRIKMANANERIRAMRIQHQAEFHNGRTDSFKLLSPYHNNKEK